MPSISDLQAKLIKRAGLARTNRFRLVIPSPFASDNGEGLDILCESCSLPGRQINTVDYSPWRNDNKIPIGYTDEDVTCVFHLTNDYYVKDTFDKWLKKIVNPDTYLIEYSETYTSDINIYQLNEADQDVYNVKLLGAWPISINSIELNNSDENNTQKVTVVFTYKTWTSEKLITSQLTGPKSITARKTAYVGDINTNTNQFLA